MAYQVQRSAKIEEELELLKEDGTVAEVIRVRLDASAVAKQVSERYTGLLNLQSQLSKIKDEAEKDKALEEMGNGVILLFQAVFGEENTERILRHYENDYIDMCRTIMPFVTEVVIPKIRREAQKVRKTKMQSYSRKKGIFGRR